MIWVLLKTLSQILHWYFFISMAIWDSLFILWNRWRWSFKCLSCLNDLSHSLHVKGLAVWCLVKWSVSLALLKALNSGHLSQVSSSISILWDLHKCITIFPQFPVNLMFAFRHSGHTKSFPFLSWQWFLWYSSFSKSIKRTPHLPLSHWVPMIDSAITIF